MNKKIILWVGLVLGLAGVIAGIYNVIEFAPYEGISPDSELEEKLYEYYHSEYEFWSTISMITGFASLGSGLSLYKTENKILAAVSVLLGTVALITSM